MRNKSKPNDKENDLNNAKYSVKTYYCVIKNIIIGVSVKETYNN